MSFIWSKSSASPDLLYNDTHLVVPLSVDASDFEQFEWNRVRVDQGFIIRFQCWRYHQIRVPCPSARKRGLYLDDHFVSVLPAHFTFLWQPILKENSPFLRQKICLMALIESVFKRPTADRVLPFSVIAAESRIPADEVEHLVMKALSSVS